MSKPALWLAIVGAVLAPAAAVAGLSWPDGGGHATTVSVQGEQVELYGQGLYSKDSLFKGAANVGTDFHGASGRERGKAFRSNRRSR